MDERKKQFKVPSVKSKLIDALKRGPLNSKQLSLRIASSSTTVSGVCGKYPDTFKKVGEVKDKGGLIAIWELIKNV